MIAKNNAGALGSVQGAGHTLSILSCWYRPRIGRDKDNTEGREKDREMLAIKRGGKIDLCKTND